MAEVYHAKLELPPIYCYVAIRDYDFPLNLNALLKRFKLNSEYNFPEFRHSRVEEFMDEAMALLVEPKHWCEYSDEQPDEWVYIMPSHSQTFRENRRSLFALDEAEFSPLLI